MGQKVQPLLRLEIEGANVDMFVDADIDTSAKSDYSEGVGRGGEVEIAGLKLETTEAAGELSIALYAFALDHVARPDKVSALADVRRCVQRGPVHVTFYAEIMKKIVSSVDAEASDICFGVVGRGEGITTTKLEMVPIPGAGWNSLCASDCR
jgi:hypothetical protein